MLDVVFPEPDELHFYPFAYALYNEYLSAFCWYCLDEKKPHKRCVGCSTAIFCNKECQTLAWKDHKFECRAFKSSNDVPDIEIRLLGRIVSRYRTILCGKDKEITDFYKDRTSQRIMMDIWAHTKNISEDSFAMRKFNMIYDQLIKFYDKKALLPRDVIFELHCRDFINRHAISDDAYIKEIGKGLYLDLCAYDHSCRPNAIYVCNGFRAMLRPLNGNTKLLDRSTTFYSYIDLFCGKQERRKLLKDTWYFNCKCERCIDNQEHILTSVNCSNCTNQTRLCLFGEQEYKDSETQLITCPICKKLLPREIVIEALALMRFIDDTLERINSEIMSRERKFEILQDLMERAKKLLPEVNVYYCKIVQGLIPLVDSGDITTLLRLHLIVEECIRICYPHNHPALGFHLRNIGIFALRLGDAEKSIKYLTESFNIFNFVMRSEHSLTKTTLKFLNKAKIMGNNLRKEDHEEVKISKASEIEPTAQVSRKVLLRCEVFAESFDNEKSNEATLKNISEEKSNTNNLKVFEKNKQNVIVDPVYEENIERNIEFAKADMREFANCLNIDKDEMFWKKQKRKEFEYAGSLKRRTKHEQKKNHHHHHHQRHGHRHHSETRKNDANSIPLTIENLKKFDAETNSLNVAPSGHTLIRHPNFHSVVLDEKAEIQIFENLFIDTRRQTPKKDNNRTGVKKKAALKKVSPRARTPLPPFKNSEANEDQLSASNLMTQNFLINEKQAIDTQDKALSSLSVPSNK